MCLTLIKQCNPLSAGNFLSSTFLGNFSRRTKFPETIAKWKLHTRQNGPKLGHAKQRHCWVLEIRTSSEVRAYWLRAGRRRGRCCHRAHRRQYRLQAHMCPGHGRLQENLPWSRGIRHMWRRGSIPAPFGHACRGRRQGGWSAVPTRPEAAWLAGRRRLISNNVPV